MLRVGRRPREQSLRLDSGRELTLLHWRVQGKNLPWFKAYCEVSIKQMALEGLSSRPASSPAGWEFGSGAQMGRDTWITAQNKAIGVNGQRAQKRPRC